MDFRNLIGTCFATVQLSFYTLCDWMCISSSPSLRANVMSFSFVENAHQKLFLGCQVILDLTLNCAIRCSAQIRAAAGGKLGTQSSRICWMRSFRGPSTRLTIQSWAKWSISMQICFQDRPSKRCRQSQQATQGSSRGVQGRRHQCQCARRG